MMFSKCLFAIRAMLILGVFVASSVAWAGDDALDFKSGIERGKNFVNGGVGQEDANAIRKLAKHYPLMVSVSEGQQGAYLAKLSLTILNEQRARVFAHQDVGPMLLVDLPDGRYQLVAEYQSQKRSVVQTLVAGKTAMVYFNWPDHSVPPKVLAPQDEVAGATDMDAPEKSAPISLPGGPDDLSIP